MASSLSLNPVEAVAMMRRFVIEVQQNGNYGLIDELCHPDFVDHTVEPGRSGKIDGVHSLMRFLHATISDLKIEIVQSISDGHTIATNKVLRGNQVGEIFGKPATHGPIEFRIMDFLKLETGLLKDHWATVGQIQDI